MAAIHWADPIDGDFDRAKDWTGDVEPGAADDAILDAAGTTRYRVTSTTAATVSSLQTASNATLLVAADQFTATHGSGTGFNAGTIELELNTTFAFGGTIDNTGLVDCVEATAIPEILVEGASALTGGGSIAVLGAGDGINIAGASTGATLVNVNNTIIGRGTIDLDNLKLVNAAGGVIEALGSKLEGEGQLTITGNEPLINNGIMIAGPSPDLQGAYLVIDATINDSDGGVIEGIGGGDIHLDGTLIGGRLESSTYIQIGYPESGREVFDGTGSTLTNTAGIEVSDQVELVLEGAISNGGKIVVGGLLEIDSSSGVTLTGGGEIILAVGPGHVTGTAALDNVDNTISGYGVVGGGGFSLINGAAGVVNATNGDLTLDTGSNTVSNAGVLEATTSSFEAKAGRLTIAGATIDNQSGGVIEAYTTEAPHSGVTVVDLVDSTVIGGELEDSNGGGIIAGADGSVLDGGDGHAVTLGGSFDIRAGVSLTVDGDLINAGELLVGEESTLLVGADGLTLAGAGRVFLNGTKGADIGATVTATLDNTDNRISGAGVIGGAGLTLVNGLGGRIISGGAMSLAIDTGSNAIESAGLIENAGTGGLVIDGAVANTGTLEAIKGTFSVDGAVTGAGTVKIEGGTADFASTFTEDVAFTTAGGVLELASATTYTGTISGFAKTSITSLDLADITFTGATVSYSGTTTSGMLTVTGGAQVAKINLTGDYLTSTFTLSSDGHGGTVVTDPPPQLLGRRSPPCPLITAIAGFGGAGGASHALVTDTGQMTPIALGGLGAAHPAEITVGHLALIATSRA